MHKSVSIGACVHLTNIHGTLTNTILLGWDLDDEGVSDKDLMDPGEQVLTAAEDGDLERLGEMLSEHPELCSVRDSDLYTPLHRAAYNNHPDAIRLLLTAGADGEAVTEQGWTALHCAACWGSWAAAQVIVAPS